MLLVAENLQVLLTSAQNIKMDVKVNIIKIIFVIYYSIFLFIISEVRLKLVEIDEDELLTVFKTGTSSQLLPYKPAIEQSNNIFFFIYSKFIHQLFKPGRICRFQP